MRDCRRCCQTWLLCTSAFLSEKPAWGLAADVHTAGLLAVHAEGSTYKLHGLRIAHVGKGALGVWSVAC